MSFQGEPGNRNGQEMGGDVEGRHQDAEREDDEWDGRECRERLVVAQDPTMVVAVAESQRSFAWRACSLWAQESESGGSAPGTRGSDAWDRRSEDLAAAG